MKKSWAGWEGDQTNPNAGGPARRVTLLAEQANFSVVSRHTFTRFATFCNEMYEKAQPG